MAATDMALAALEEGCVVEIPAPTAASNTDRAPEHNAHVLSVIARMDAPVRFIDTDRGEKVIVRDVHGTETWLFATDVQRDYADAQRARHTRVDRLLAAYPCEAGCPEETDTVERFVGVQVGPGEFALVWGDTFDDVAQQLGAELIDRWLPEAVYDLDTGERVPLHIATPVVSRGEALAVENVLDLDLATMTAHPTLPAPAGFSDEQVSAALNSAADDILAALDAGDHGVRDVVNLLVNAAAHYLQRPGDDLQHVVAANYDTATLADVLGWCRS